MKTKFVILIILFFGGCFLFPDDQTPLGESKMSAVVNGEKVIFTDVKGGEYLGMHLYGQSKYRISIDILTEIGTYTWRSKQGPLGEIPKAEFVYYSTIDSIGGLTITNYNTDKRLIEGKFEFKAIRSDIPDTVEVKSGEFILYYTIGK